MDMKPQPDLAESYENVDESTWHFKIREGVKFHNGDTMTVDDVVACSLQWAQRPLCRSQSVQQELRSISKVDDSTVPRSAPMAPTPWFAEPVPSWQRHLVPKKLIDAGQASNTDPIGTGPYKLVEWKRGSLEFEAFSKTSIKALPKIKKHDLERSSPKALPVPSLWKLAKSTSSGSGSHGRRSSEGKQRSGSVISFGAHQPQTG